MNAKPNWFCQVCGQPIRGESGSIALFSVTPENERTDPREDLPLRMVVAHHECDTTEVGYWIGCDRAETPEDWMRWALHLATKYWFLKPEKHQTKPTDGPVFCSLAELAEEYADMEEARFKRFLAFWFTGRRRPQHPLPG